MNEFESIVMAIVDELKSVNDELKNITKEPFMKQKVRNIPAEDENA